MAIPRQCFGEDIRQLIMRGNIGHRYLVRDDMLTNEVAIDPNVFCALLIDSVLIALVLSAYRRVGLVKKTASSLRRRQSQITTLLVEDIERYSASAGDLDTVVCLLHFHEIGDVPRNIHQLVVERRVSEQPAQ